ncbi:probable calcium-binding protein CML25 [Neltuma alba]|uniref:probable calcium-binding protein CML25 n=1 Tax=Neltuma alba TaxID=207710 RepID=UPI0010A48CC5|nr:probable calcium-binding protein CML25 [Prosopis alba]
MGFKSLFSRKKKLLESAAQSPITSRSPSLSMHSRAQLTAELEEVFKRFDVNGDGKISASELGSILGSLGEPATEEELNNMIREVDADGDGFISLQEFVELNTKGIDSVEAMENLKDAFSVFDIDGNGKITAEELQMVMKSLGDDCSVVECRRMINGVDSDGDGQIDFEEFKVMMMMGSRHDTSDRVKPE